MRFHYSKTKDAFYIRFDERVYHESDEVADGVIIDYDRQGHLLGLEILEASKCLSPRLRASLKRQELPFRLSLSG